MRGAILATAAALAGTAVADVHMRRHAHEGLHNRGLHHSSAIPKPEESCGCTTEVITYWGEPTMVPIEVPTSTVTSETTTTVESTSYTTITVTATSESPEVTLPTPGVTSFTETGTYTIPATTITVTDTTTVCGATTTDLPSGTHTYGGVTTIVETATTITCPIATVKPSGSTVTSIIELTTYVCPTPGTYTINPTTTYVPTETVIVYPTPATITPGTYTNPASTITVTRTDYTYVCPYTNVNEPTAEPTAEPTSEPTSSVPAAVPSSTSTSTATSVPVATSGPGLGMTFTPYETNGECMSKANVIKNVGIIKEKGFTHVRVYGTDCYTLEYVGAACKTHGLKMILGVFIDGSGIGDAVHSQVNDIASWAQWDIVALISAGNEAVTNGFVQPGDLAAFVTSAKATWAAAGYTGEVTVAEAINPWLEHGSTLCSVVDVIGANLHPFFNAEFSASQAGELVSNQIRDIKAVCPGKDLINLETGWPNAGLANGKAIPSPSEQAIAIKSLVEKVGSVSVFFSYSDDAWKSKFQSSDQFKVETHWGCIDQF
ncbi:glycoside hydrolase superfamily [Aspergillus granulosus]|uniref:Probable beta-glucosidase btgE n=1 Tax=Aspergillus granulosus TaxID=176169 RepID=A0ABR4HRJ2_9EURO